MSATPTHEQEAPPLDATAATHGDGGGAETLVAFLQRVTGSPDPDAATLLAHLRASSDDPMQQAIICAALEQVIQRGELLVRADEVNAAVAAAMSAHCDHALLQLRGCVVIAQVPLGAHGHSAAGATRAMDAVMAAMRAHPSDALLQQACCTALASIVALKEVNISGAVAAGAVRAVVGTMLAHRAHPGVQSGGCNALTCLVHLHGDGDLATNYGAVDAVIAALQAHPGDACVQDNGCLALGNVLAAMGSAAAASVRTRAYELGAVTAVVGALRAHPTNAGVALRGCSALRHLTCEHQPSQREAEHAGAIDAVTAAMRAHLHDANVQAGGCKVLSIAFGRSTRAAGCTVMMDAVLAAMRAHPTNADVQMHGCMTLPCTFADDEDICRAAIEAGVIEAVVAALALRCPEQLVLYKFAWCCIFWLSRDCEAYHDRAVRAGALDALTVAIELPDDVANAPGRVQLIARLLAATKRHDDAAACEHAAACARCAALRARGERCALPGCGARKREGAANKTLLLCAACRGAARYCGPAHQRADWVRHKPACRLLAEEEQ
jgi:hypothetical protein